MDYSKKKQGKDISSQDKLSNTAPSSQASGDNWEQEQEKEEIDQKDTSLTTPTALSLSWSSIVTTPTSSQTPDDLMNQDSLWKLKIEKESASKSLTKLVSLSSDLLSQRKHLPTIVYNDIRKRDSNGEDMDNSISFPAVPLTLVSLL